jgi:hypothetical protein
MYRRVGRLEAALETTTRILEQQPDDVLAALDVAELNQALNNLDATVAAYTRLRAIDTEPGHEVYAYHGMIHAEIQRERWRRALDLAIDVTRVDRYDLTTQLLAFLTHRVFGKTDHPPPAWPDLEAALAAERHQHRRLHTEALVS